MSLKKHLTRKHISEASYQKFNPSMLKEQMDVILTDLGLPKMEVEQVQVDGIHNTPNCSVFKYSDMKKRRGIILTQSLKDKLNSIGSTTFGQGAELYFLDTKLSALILKTS